MQTFKLFVSSPGDVMVERRRIDNVVGRINGEFAGVARLEAIRWETEFYQAYSTFQAQIPRSTECDLVIGILRWRLGTELPPDFAEKLPGDRLFPSGTAYEILTAIEHRQKGGTLPDIYVFRYAGGSPPVQLDDPNRIKIEGDWQSLKSFIEQWFLTAQGHFKAAFNHYTSEDDFEAQLQKLLRKWVAERVGGRTVRWPVAVKGSPFCGLSAFGPKHAPVFFGRGDDISRAVDLWREAADRGSQYLLVVGASGSGKSSLARAGLIPRLVTPGVIKNVDAWRISVMRPGDSPEGPFVALATALMQDEAALPKEEEGRGPALPEIAQGDSQTPAELAAVLRHADAGCVKPIVTALGRVGAGERNRERYNREVRCDLVLLIDQFEELFAASVSDAERNAFIDLLVALVATGRVWIATTLRADFYARILAQPGLKKLKELGETYDLAPPGPVELADIVRGPAEAAGLIFETSATAGERLDARLLEDGDRPDMLPLVELALSRLFEGREILEGQMVLRFKVYESLGGLKGIVNEAGEKALAPLGETEKDQLPRLLRQLAIPAHEKDGIGKGALTIRAVPLSQVAPDGNESAQKLIAALIDARLLTTAGTAADAQVRLTHQRVLEDWSRAHSIVREGVDFYRIRAELEESRRKWEDGKRRSELLLARGLPLAEAVSITDKYGNELAPETLAYVRVSRQRAQRVQVIAWGAAAVFCLLAVGAGFSAKVASYQRAAANRATSEAKTNLALSEQERLRAETNLAISQQHQSHFLVNLSDQYLEASDQSTALLLALEGLPDDQAHVSRSYVADAELALFSSWQRLRETKIFEEPDQLLKASFSPDGTRVVVLGSTQDGAEAKVLDADTGRTIITLPGGNDGIVAANFSPDGRRLVTTYGAKTCIQDAETGKTLLEMRGHNGLVSNASFSADGQRVVTASSDGTARVWNAQTGATILILKVGTTAVSGAVFSPDGRRVVTTAVGDNTAKIWNAQTGAMILILKGHTSFISSAAFSPDGKAIITASEDQTARVWNAETGKMIQTLSGHQTGLTSANFSPDGERIVTTASGDPTVYIWDAKTGQIVTRLVGHRLQVNSAEFSFDNNRILTASLDQTARIWELSRDGVVTALRGHEGKIWSARFSPGGDRVVTASEDKSARVWEVASRKTIKVLLGHQGVVYDAEFSPDGRYVVTASEDETARIWDTESSQTVAVLRGHKGRVVSATFSPDATRVLTGSEDGTARIWDSKTGETLMVLAGHKDMVRSVAYSADGHRIATGSGDGTARIWNADSGQTIMVIPIGPDVEVQSVAFSPDSPRILIALYYPGLANIFDTDTGAFTGTSIVVPGPLGASLYMAAATFSPNGQRIATASPDNNAAYIWGSTSRSTVGILLGHDDKVNTVAFNHDGHEAITGSSDATARIWKVFATTQDLVDQAKLDVQRCLTVEERKKDFLASEPPDWCIEMEKWPYRSQDWKDWLKYKRQNANPPLPSSEDWSTWIAARRPDKEESNVKEQ